MKGSILAVVLLAGGISFSPLPAAADKIGSAGRQDTEMKSLIHSANEFIGLEVVDKEGEKIGQIQDVLFDLEQGRIAFAVISAGGVMGIADTNYLVPWRALSAPHEGPKVTLNLSKGKLAEAPNRTAEMSDQEFHRELHDFYGVSPSWKTRPHTAVGKKKQP